MIAEINKVLVVGEKLSVWGSLDVFRQAVPEPWFSSRKWSVTDSDYSREGRTSRSLG